MAMHDPVVHELRTVAAFDEYLDAGKANGTRWIIHVVSALRSEGCRIALNLPPDASDGELFQELAKVKDKKNSKDSAKIRILIKGGCELKSAIQAETHLRNLTFARPRTAWEREARSPTGKLDRVKSKSMWAFLKRNLLIMNAGLFFLLSLALLGLAGWMRLHRKYFDFLGRHWWAYPHGLFGAAGLFFIGMSFALVHLFSQCDCCIRCCGCLRRCCCDRVCGCCWDDDDSCCLYWPIVDCYDRVRNLCRRRKRAPSIQEFDEAPKGRRTRRGSLGSLFFSSKPEDAPVDEFEGMGDVPDTPIPDARTLALAMISPSPSSRFAHTDDSFGNDLEAETTMMPRRLRSSHGDGKAVSFQSEANAAEVPTQQTMPTTVVASPKAKWEAPPVVIGGSISALWHDHSYSFSSRFASQAARLAAEETRDPTMIASHPVKPTAEQRVGVRQHLKELVVDLPVEGVEHELRPHMVQFWQDTTFQSEPKYPHWHPGSTRSHEQKDDLQKCLTNPKKLNLIKPLMKALPPKHTEMRGFEGDGPRNASDAVSLMAASRFGLESPLTSDHLVGLTHPEEFGPGDDDVRFDAFGGPSQQTVYGWTSPAGPRYVAPVTSKKGPGPADTEQSADSQG